MPDLQERVPETAIRSRQAEAFLAALAPGLALAMETLRGLVPLRLPPALDTSRQATAARVGYLTTLLLIADGDDEAATLLSRCAPRVNGLRPASEDDELVVGDLGAVMTAALETAERFGPRRVLGRVPPLDGRGLEEAEAAIEGRGVGALIQIVRPCLADPAQAKATLARSAQLGDAEIASRELSVEDQRAELRSLLCDIADLCYYLDSERVSVPGFVANPAELRVQLHAYLAKMPRGGQ
jgi:hypothetical protein